MHICIIHIHMHILIYIHIFIYIYIYIAYCSVPIDYGLLPIWSPGIWAKGSPMLPKVLPCPAAT